MQRLLLQPYHTSYLVHVLIGGSGAPPTSNAEAERLAGFLDQLENDLKTTNVSNLKQVVDV